MKNLKSLSVASFCLLTAIILSSCGIMRNNDFSTQKYTNFKKGKSTVNINKVNKEKKDVDLYSVVPDKKEVTEVTTVASEKTSQTNISSITEIKKKPFKTVNNNIILKETKKNKINKAVSLLKPRLANKANTASYDVDGLSLFWIVILILLILWAIGLASGGFGIGGLINVLLVIALVLLILWLLQIV
jgi:hypothetical protein